MDLCQNKGRYIPIVHILFTLSSLWLMVQAIISNPTACLVGAGIILSGLQVYHLQLQRK
jgi:hypothetical protein